MNHKMVLHCPQKQHYLHLQLHKETKMILDCCEPGTAQTTCTVPVAERTLLEEDQLPHTSSCPSWNMEFCHHHTLLLQSNNSINITEEVNFIYIL